MARQRRPGGGDKSHNKSNGQSSAKPKAEISYTRIVVTGACFIVAACVGLGFKGYLETRVNTRFDNVAMVKHTGLEVPDRYWGSYRPGLYFGMKTRDPHSLVAGLMWYFPRTVRPNGEGLRHWCEQSDNLDHYSWYEHDGRNFGIQDIQDGAYHVKTSFVKRLGGNHGGDWTAKVSVSTDDQKLINDEVSLIFYVAIEEKTGGWINPSLYDGKLFSGIVGETSGLGHFKFTLYNETGEIIHDSYLSTVVPGLHVLKESVVNSMKLVQRKGTGKRNRVLPGELLRAPDGTKASPNFVALQVTAQMPFEVTFVFESESFLNRPNVLNGDVYEKALKKHSDAFHNKFEQIFHLKEKGFLRDQINFAKAALSNMIGGIGYFYGSSRVKSAHTEGTVPYWKAPLYSGVPSRSFFPRGFLWDEGFHGLLISTWDLDIEFDIINHWFDLMNIEGWIPREQILGVEALSKVPEEFVTQLNTNANPPVFFLTLEFILRNFGEKLVTERKLTDLDHLYQRFQAWFDWFNVTQVGEVSGSYRWRGRDPKTTRELNPKTLTSGLDDYPRASHPTEIERHLDLRCWITMASNVLSDISDILKRNGRRYENTYNYLFEPNLLEKLHWSPKTERFADYGLHTDFVVLKKPPRIHRPGQHPQQPEKIRVVLSDPELRLVDSVFGYVNLFPLLLQLIEPNDPKLGVLLKDLKKPELLWTEFGLRSLATNSPGYMQYNTEHDPPYWRGPIWININYLAVRSLNHYSKLDGPFKHEALSLYKELRDNVIKNIYREYKRSGFIWEQYDDKTGWGKGCRPFTGWSALTVLMMAEIY